MKNQIKSTAHFKYRRRKEYIKNQLKEDDVADKSTRTCLWLAEENKARWTTTFSGCL